jgi:hydroxyacylglutathione hydrolase
VEPANTELQHYLAHCQLLRAKDLPTLPSSMAQERNINPFLRSRLATVIAAVTQHDATMAQRDGVFAALRQWKNDYR